MAPADLLASVTDRRVAALRKHLPDALGGDPTGVHQARVASRRLRETLPVLEPADREGDVRRGQRVLRRVTRALGPVREIDVALGVLAEHLEAHPEEVVEGMVVRGWLERLRADRREAMLERLGDSHVERLWKRLAKVDEALPRIAEDGQAVWRTALGARIRERAETLREEVARTGVLYAPEPLHAVRIACKKLRYAVELAGELKLGATNGLERVLKRQQELLGRIHDLEVLVGFADRACAETPRRVNAARLAGDWHRECRELHARYLRARVNVDRTATRALVLGRHLARPAGSRRRTRTSPTPSAKDRPDA